MTPTGSLSDSRPQWRATLLLSFLAFAWMEGVAITRFLSGRWYLADVGSIHYALVNTMRGAFMVSPMVEGNHFGYHFTPFLLLAAPFTLLSAYPIPLVTSYVLALALCPLALFRIARNAGLPGWISASVGVFFLGNVFVGSIQLADHFESYYVLFMLATMAFSPAGGWRFWTCAVLALAVKEDAAVWMAGFAAFLWWRGRQSSRRDEIRRRAVLLALTSAGWLLMAVMVIWAVGSRQEGSAAFYLERTGGIRLGWDTVRTLTMLFASTGFLALFGGASTGLALFPIPFLLPEFPFTRNLLYYYSYPFVPFLMLASVDGLSRIRHWLLHRGWRERQVVGMLAFFPAAVGLVQFPLPTRSDGYHRVPVKVTSRDLYRLEVARELLPPRAPVVLQFGLWGVTPTRAGARKLSEGKLPPEAYIFLDFRSPYGMPTAQYREVVAGLVGEFHSGERRLLHRRGEILLFSPRSPELENP